MLSPSEQLKIISSCPVCNAQNFPEQIKVINQSEGSHLLFIQCRKCKGRVVVLVTQSMHGLSSVGILTELNSDEIMKFSQRLPIVANDVIDVYRFFQQKKQNWLALI